MGFSQGLSGLNATQRNLTTIGNNIANSQTVGYKGGRTEFADMFAGSIGLGTKVSDVSRDYTGGSITTTGRNMDLAINGGGFFRLSQQDQIVYSRNGQFHRTKEGYIANAQGALLTGYNVSNFNGATGSPTINTSGEPDTIQLPTTSLQAKATTDASLVADLDSGAEAPTLSFDPDNSDTYNWSTPYTVYDSLGNAHSVNLYFAKDDINQWTVYGRMTLGKAAEWASSVSNSSGVVYPSGFDPVNHTGSSLNGSHSVGSNYEATVSGATQAPGTWDFTSASISYQAPDSWPTSVGQGGFPEGTDLTTTSDDLSTGITYTFNVDGQSVSATVSGATGGPGSWSGGSISYDLSSLDQSGVATLRGGRDLSASPTNPSGSWANSGTYDVSLGGDTFEATVSGVTGTEGTWSGGQISYTETMSPVQLAFTSNGKLDTVDGSGASAASLTFNAQNGSNPISFDLDFAGTTQTAQKFGANSIVQNGHAPGSLVGISVEDSGMVRGSYSNGETVDLAQLAMARFQSNYGLDPAGDNAYMETGASGQAILGLAGEGQFGALRGGALEESNVDLSKELVHMIIAQRTYQANAQTIQTQSQVLQTAVNLAR